MMTSIMVSIRKFAYLILSPENIDRWAVICNSDKVSEAFMNELQTYFAIRHKDQMKVMKENFCYQLDAIRTNVLGACPMSKDGICT